MRRTFAVLGFSAVLASAALSFTLVANGPTRAAGNGEDAVFLIPAHDGYGVADCLTGGSPCGTVVANAWCEAHGFSAARSFGPAVPEEVTSAVDGLSSRRNQRPISITCRN